MDYQYFEEESDYIDLDEDEDDELGEAAGGLDYRFGKPEDEEDYYMGGEEAEESDDYSHGLLGLAERFRESLLTCVEPSLLQVLQYVTPMLLLCLLCRHLCLLYSQRKRLTSLAPLHLLHFICGLILLQFSVGYRLFLLLLLAAVGYLLLQLLRLGRQGARILAILTVGSQFLYELLLWRGRSDWPQLRGIQMVVNMKLISLGFDLTAGSGQLQARIPGSLAYLGYLYSPATCALGPWVSFGSYMDCLVPRNSWLVSLRRLVPNVLLCVLAVIVSNCLAPALSDFFGDSSHFLVMYWDALSVRFSHYFVAIMAQALLVAADQKLDGSVEESPLLGPLVSQPWLIEWPRSISALVRSWNIPMHEWLKRYIYAPCKADGSRGRIVLSVFCTYLVSSLLHGMDLRIYLVLISLAVFAEGESLLRRHLSNTLDACISSNLCPGKERCRYSRCSSKRGWSSISYWLVRAANLAFTALAIFHLAYLGVVLLGDALEVESSDESDNFLWHWQQAGYLSHYIGAGTFVLYLFIS
ncbi:protein-serine O-palmitoleoyltransferase porcupine [Drosophila ficusphila]|uniref:protein-serine O-palmitoleoyltransferase porcupine n=1 Tax=Drosophila ficusphila TaxID=30025 RepID=UPI0007E80372|nr:protein-serine O-palmitoleoyltransferase porcupine [Drosophila ficusphila]